MIQEDSALTGKRMQHSIALVLAASLLLSGSAAALFRKSGKEQTVAEGAPYARDLKIGTYRNIPYEGRFLASDSEGDDMTYKVVREPKKGTVVIDGMSFTYTPEKNAVGGDSFTYVATDSGGHDSLPATVTVTIEKTRSGVAYADMDDHPSAAAAAQYLAESGIFTGAKIGERYYFEPEKTVSRSEFLALVMETAGRKVDAVTMTGFCDDASIPVWAKAYASAGVADGIVQGKTTEQGAAFRGEETITYNEAATILNRALNMGNVDVSVLYADRESVPSWASQAVGNMEALSVLSAGSFGSQTMGLPVNRAEAAKMLSAAKTLLNGEQSSSWQDWLK